MRQGLSERQIEVLRLLAQGKSDEEIAQRLVIERNTVGCHVKRMLHRLGLARRTHLVLYALKEGFIDLDEIELPLKPEAELRTETIEACQLLAELGLPALTE